MSTLADLVTPDRILLGCPATTSDEVIRTLSALLEESGHVQPGYADACIRREATDPTGLPLADLNVAIPHADPDLVTKAGLAVAVPERPLTFRQMGDPDIEVPAAAVFLLALTGPEEQLQALREVAEFVQDPGRVRALVEATEPQEVHAMFVDQVQEQNE